MSTIVKEEFIDGIVLKDLSNKMYKKLGVGFDLNNRYEPASITKRETVSDLVDVDEMIEALQKLKEAGATHVSIDGSCADDGWTVDGEIDYGNIDHMDKYKIDGLKITVKQ